MNDDFSNFTAYLKREHEAGRLSIVAAKAKLPEYVLREIATDERDIDESTVYALSFVTEPIDDRWVLDEEDPNFLVVPDLTDEQMIERLQHAERAGKLGVIAEVSGVKGGERTLQDICNIGPHAKLDPVTRSLLLNVMEE